MYGSDPPQRLREIQVNQRGGSSMSWSELLAIFGLGLLSCALLVVGWVNGAGVCVFAAAALGATTLFLLVVARTVPLQLVLWQQPRQRIAVAGIVLGLGVLVCGIEGELGVIRSLSAIVAGSAVAVIAITLLRRWTPFPPHGYAWKVRSDGRLELVQVAQLATIHVLPVVRKPRPRAQTERDGHRG